MREAEKSRKALEAARRYSNSRAEMKMAYLLGEAVVTALWDLADAIDANTESQRATLQQAPQPVAPEAA